MQKKRGGMGFKDISSFNLAMLAKQAWRLTHQDHSLFYRVYKAWYFPNCSFLMVELGSNSSYVWWSLLAARDVIWEGSSWRVGDGQQIGVMSHKWLAITPIFLHEPMGDMKVCDLIDRSTRQWDQGKIAATFTPRTCTKILAIPLNQLDSQDSLIWITNKTHSFSVKSAYQIALRLKTPKRPEHSLTRPIEQLGGKSGSSKSIKATCKFCRSETETVAHMLWMCPFARNVWALAKGRI